MGSPAAGEVGTLPPTKKKRTGRPLDIFGGTAVSHALLIQGNLWPLSWVFKKTAQKLLKDT